MPGPILTTSLAAAWGPIRLAASIRGIVAVEQLTSPEEFDARLTRRFGTTPVPLGDVPADQVADQVADQPAHHAAAMHTAADQPALHAAAIHAAATHAAADQAALHAATRHLRAARAAFERFLAGELAALDDLPIDIGDRTSWDRDVLAAVRTIRAGSTASYGEVARMVGRPGAARAVGGAVGRNPLGLVVPCHRVIAGDGTIGGYGGGWWGGRQAGLELKRELLAREGVHLGPVRAER